MVRASASLDVGACLVFSGNNMRQQSFARDTVLFGVECASVTHLDCSLLPRRTCLNTNN